MQSKQYSLPTVGKILVCKHPKSKKLSIKIRANALPKVIIPTQMTYEMGFRFAAEKENWIIQSQKKVALNQKQQSIQSQFKTRFHTITFSHHSKPVIESNKQGSSIQLLFPEKEKLEDEANQLKIKNFIINILRMEAKKYLPARTQYLAHSYDFKFNQIFIKNLKSRWGSCSGKNNINLNLHLMRLPEHLSDFIILHELCHTIHKNHGPKFHELLNTIVGDEKALNKELKKYTTIL